MKKKTMGAWIQALRPKTLMAAFVPVVGAWVLAFGESSSSSSVILFPFVLLAAICVQISTNLFNDYFDFKKGSDTSRRLGPKRALHQGVATPKQVLGAAFLFDVLALLFAIPLFQERGWHLLGVGLICVCMAALYTGGPLALTHLGLGELFVLIFFGWVATYYSYFVFTGVYSPHATLLGIQLGLLSCVLITINNLRDYEEDRSTGKKTLVVRFGKNFGLLLLILELALPYYFQIQWRGIQLYFWLPFMALPLAFLIARGMLIEKMSLKTNRFLAFASLHALIFLSLWSLAELMS